MIIFPPVILLGLAVLFFLAGLGFALLLRKRGLRIMGARHRLRGKHAEIDAAQLLESEGFRILEVEPRIRHALYVNGELTNFEITPDFLVEKDDQPYVVEVKRASGGIHNAAVRRQALEYMVAANLPCLLVLMPEGDMDLVETEAFFEGNS